MILYTQHQKTNTCKFFVSSKFHSCCCRSNVILLLSRYKFVTSHKALNFKNNQHNQKNIAKVYFSNNVVKNMSILLDKSIQINRTVSLNEEEAYALGTSIRAEIVEMLYKKTMNVFEIAKNLKQAEHDKTTSAIRHHINVLKKAKLIEVVKIEERRGTVMKHYGTSIKLIRLELTDDFEKKYSKEIEKTTLKLKKNLNWLETQIPQHEGKNNPHTQQIMFEIVNRVMTNMFKDNDSQLAS